MRSRILIVDDNQDTLITCSAVLSKAGYLISTATDGFLAMRHLNEERMGLVLLDVSMPGMDGFDVCRAIKGNSDLYHIPVLFLSARVDPGSQAFGMSLGAADYLSKPIQPAEVLLKAKKYCLKDPPPSP
ncbi:MAG: response regulator [Nitrospirae bacterium]|nr:response regulator [Candidatus Manganitrophaceae bacterium]